MRDPVLEVILAELEGTRRVLDVGCGVGALAKTLTARGFDVTGIDPQAGVIERARVSVPDAKFLAASAAALPYREGSFDAAVFLNSLHHVPGSDMDAAVAEADRVTRPGGRVVVVEPMAEGPLFEVLRPIDDETGTRAEAQAALDRALLPAVTDCRFDRVTTYTDMDAFTRSLLAGDPARAGAIKASSEALAAAIERHAIRVAGGFALVQPMRLRSFTA